MKKIFSAVLGGCLLLGACAATEQKTITIKGKVQFPDNSFNMEIVERNGFDKTIIDSCKVNEDGTYRFTIPVYIRWIARNGSPYSSGQRMRIWRSISVVWIRPGSRSRIRRTYILMADLTMK